MIASNDCFKEIVLSFARPYMDAEDFNTKVCLEVGCGSGRPGVTACRLGAEVIGMDISEAVAAHPLSHLVTHPDHNKVSLKKFQEEFTQSIPSGRTLLVGLIAW